VKFSKEYSKLDLPLFTTVRFNRGYYKPNMIVNCETPSKAFRALVIGVRKITTDEISEELAQFDADLCKYDFIQLMKRFYKDQYNDLVLVTLLKIL